MMPVIHEIVFQDLQDNFEIDPPEINAQKGDSVNFINKIVGEVVAVKFQETTPFDVSEFEVRINLELPVSDDADEITHTFEAEVVGVRPPLTADITIIEGNVPPESTSCA